MLTKIMYFMKKKQYFYDTRKVRRVISSHMFQNFFKYPATVKDIWVLSHLCFCIKYTAEYFS